MNKKIIVLLSIFFIIACSGAVFAQDVDNNDTVSSIDDISVDDAVSSMDDVADGRLQSTVNVSGNKFSDIQTAVNNAKDNDIIELNGKYTGNKKAIKVSKSLTIQSTNGATLDAKKLSQIFDITGKNVVLKGLTFINSEDSAINVPCDGKIYNLEIINCTFSQNGGGPDGGAIFYVCDGTLTIVNSTFSGNNAGFGGAVYGGGNFKIYNSKFTDNKARDEGGAIHYGGDSLYVYDSIFTSNSAKDECGGAIYSDWGSGTISNSIFNKNSAPVGGSIGFGGKLTISDCNFTSSSTNEAGAILFSGELADDQSIKSNLIVSNSNFKGCTSKGYANSIFAKYANVDISNSTFDSKEHEAYIVIGTLKNTNNTGLKYKVVNTLTVKFSTNIKQTTYDSYTPLRVWMYAGVINHELLNHKVKVKITSGSKKIREYTTHVEDEYSYALIWVSDLPVGKYKVKVSVDGKYIKPASFTTKITIKKAKTIVTAKKITAKYKKSKQFKVKVRSKVSGEAVKKLKLKIKVYTGKKAKSYTVKTNKKGIAKINTKKLKKGKHKVVITSKNKNYSVNKKSSIKIK